MCDESKKLSTVQLLNFCLGFFGLQFAWQMRFILTGPVTESLGANVLVLGIISLAGPVTGMVVQPLIGALSDNTQTRFGRRIPYLFMGALLGSIGLILMPHSGQIASLLGENVPIWTGLLIAAIMIWLIDGSVNAAQGPYRALVPDNIPKEQHAIANSFLSFSIGLGSVVAAITAPVLKMLFNIEMSANAQFLMAGIAFFLTMFWTCITFRERKIPQKTEEKISDEEIEQTFAEKMKSFFSASPEILKICVIQFFSWIGIMSLMIYFTQYVVHIIYQVPTLSEITNEALKASYNQAVVDGQLFSGLCFGVFNFVCFVVAIPIGYLASKFGNVKIHFISMTTMAIAFLLMAFVPTKTATLIAMGLAGIGWASVLALPFAMLSKYLKPGTEGSMMGIFNIFISAPQVLVCTLLAWFINKATFTLNGLQNNHWEYIFIVGAIMLVGAAISTLTVKEK